MAYDPQYLGGPVQFGSHAHQRLWSLDSVDTLATIVGAGYVSDGATRGMLKGDIVYVRRFDNLDLRTTLSGISQHYVSSVGASSVTIASDWDTSQDTDLAEQATLEYIAISSKAADAAVARFVAPWAFKIKSASVVLNGALATGDATTTLAIAGVGVTGGVITSTQTSSAAGDIATCTPSALNTGAANALITATIGGASTATATLNIFLLLERTS